MKKITAILVLLGGIIVFGQGMKFEENSFKNVLAKAKKENKLIFMDAYTSWCGPCKMMAKNVFPKENVGKFYNTTFINTKFDMEKGEGVDIAKKYKVNSFPTFLFINGDGEVVHRVSGYFEENDFIGMGKDASDPSKQMAALKKRIDSGEKDPDFLKNVMKMFAFSDADLARKAAERYFNAKKGQQLSQEDLGLLFTLIPDSSSPLYTIFTERKADLLKIMPEGNYNQIIKKYQLASVMNLVYNKETKKLDEDKFMTEAGKLMTKDEAKTLLTQVKIKNAAATKNYPEYQKLAIEYYGEGNAPNFTSDELNTVAWDFFEKIDDKEALKKAVLWAQQSVSKNENSANTDTLANLYYKTGDNKNAKIWALKSIELAKKSGEDYESTQQLLDKLK